jgi:hypothetical protein
MKPSTFMISVTVRNACPMLSKEYAGWPSTPAYTGFAQRLVVFRPVSGSMKLPLQVLYPVAAGLLQRWNSPENSDTPRIAKMSDTNCAKMVTLMTSVKDDMSDDTTMRMLALPRTTRRGRSARPSRNTRKNDTPEFEKKRSTSIAADQEHKDTNSEQRCDHSER